MARDNAEKAAEYRALARESSVFEDRAILHKDWCLRVANGDEPNADLRSDVYVGGPVKWGVYPKIMAPLCERWNDIGLIYDGQAVLRSASLGGGFGTVAAYYALQEAERRYQAHVRDSHTAWVWKGLCVVRWPKHWGIPLFNWVPSTWTPRGYFNFPRQRISFFVLGHPGAIFTCEQKEYKEKGIALTEDPALQIFGGSDGPAIDFSNPEGWGANREEIRLKPFFQDMEKEGWKPY